MTQEEKQLLLKDLSARVPYGVKISIPELWISEKKIEVLKEIFKGDDGLYRVNDNGIIIEYIKPYLFPLSSITEEQRFELKKQHSKDGKILQEICKEIYTNPNLDKSGLGVTYNAVDWCNANHFDYRGLIPLGLANDATGLHIYD